MAAPSEGAGRRQGTVKAKVVLLGEGAVGKTSIVLRYSENKYNDKHEQTLQVAIYVCVWSLIICVSMYVDGSHN